MARKWDVAGVAFGLGTSLLFIKPAITALQASVAPPGVSVTTQQNGTTTVSFQMLATGGRTPYSYSALWADGSIQSSANGYFTRDFAPGETIPKSALVTIKSADGQMVLIDG